MSEVRQSFTKASERKRPREMRCVWKIYRFLKLIDRCFNVSKAWRLREYHSTHRINEMNGDKYKGMRRETEDHGHCSCPATHSQVPFKRSLINSILTCDETWAHRKLHRGSSPVALKPESRMWRGWLHDISKASAVNSFVAFCQVSIFVLGG